jgi:hypothetical protein
LFAIFPMAFYSGKISALCRLAETGLSRLPTIRFPY